MLLLILLLNFSVNASAIFMGACELQCSAFLHFLGSCEQNIHLLSWLLHYQLTTKPLLAFHMSSYWHHIVSDFSVYFLISLSTCVIHQVCTNVNSRIMYPPYVTIFLGRKSTTLQTRFFLLYLLRSFTCLSILQTVTARQFSCIFTFSCFFDQEFS